MTSPVKRKVPSSPTDSALREDSSKTTKKDKDFFRDRFEKAVHTISDTTKRIRTDIKDVGKKIKDVLHNLREKRKENRQALINTVRIARQKVSAVFPRDFKFDSKNHPLIQEMAKKYKSMMAEARSSTERPTASTREMPVTRTNPPPMPRALSPETALEETDTSSSVEEESEESSISDIANLFTPMLYCPAATDLQNLGTRLQALIDAGVSETSEEYVQLSLQYEEGTNKLLKEFGDVTEFIGAHLEQHLPWYIVMEDATSQEQAMAFIKQEYESYFASDPTARKLGVPAEYAELMAYIEAHPQEHAPWREIMVDKEKEETALYFRQEIENYTRDGNLGVPRLIEVSTTSP